MFQQTPRRRVHVTHESFTSHPAMDTAVSRALLHRVAEGVQPETLRLHRPSAIVAFGVQDTRAPGYRLAVDAAHAHGFEAIERLAGGRAAVFHEETIAFSWTLADPEAVLRVHDRFREAAAIMAAAFRRLGVDARVGEVPGEYCPGDYSVSARGERKVMGVGQRVIRGAAHVGGVVVVGRSDRVRDVLVPVYDALDLAWRPETAGSIQDEVPGATWNDVLNAIADEFAARYDLTATAISPETLALAETFIERHAVG